VQWYSSARDIYYADYDRRTRRDRGIALAAFNNLALEIPCRSFLPTPSSSPHRHASDFSFFPRERSRAIARESGTRAANRNINAMREFAARIRRAGIRGLNATIKAQSQKRVSSQRADHRAYLRSAFVPLPFGDSDNELSREFRSRDLLNIEARPLPRANRDHCCFCRARARASAFGKFNFYFPKAVSRISPKRNSAFRRRSFDLATRE